MDLAPRGTRERFEREAQVISSLQHRNICTLHDVGRDAGIVVGRLEHDGLVPRSSLDGLRRRLKWRAKPQ